MQAGLLYPARRLSQGLEHIAGSPPSRPTLRRLLSLGPCCPRGAWSLGSQNRQGHGANVVYEDGGLSLTDVDPGLEQDLQGPQNMLEKPSQ